MLVRVLPFAVILGAIPFIIYAGMTGAFRLGIIDFLDIFDALGTWLSPALMVGCVLSLASVIVGAVTGAFRLAAVAVVFTLATSGTLYALSEFKGKAGQVPPIHDITTDTIDPPAFDVTAKERTPSDRPAAYDREQTAQQLEFYTDLAPIVVEAPFMEVFAVVEIAMTEAGVEIKSSDHKKGHIEGTATTWWFGFKDDVVARIRPGEGDVLVIDIRSKSRIGRSDVGANAARIRSIRDKIIGHFPIVE